MADHLHGAVMTDPADTPEGRTPTRRTKLVQEFDVFRDGSEQRLKRVEAKAKRARWWLQALGGAVAAVFLAGVWVARYTADLAHEHDVAALATRLTVQETRTVDMQTQVQLVADQVREIARTVHAPVVVPPADTRLDAPVVAPKAVK